MRLGYGLSVDSCGMEAFWAVRKMYDAFEPKGGVQGLPPVSDYTRRTWVEAIMGVSWNFVVRDGYRVVGHAAAIADTRRREAEYLIFILPAYQNRGLGSALTKLAMEYLREKGIDKVTLEVQLGNLRAIRLYQKFSFEFPQQNDSPARIMACTLSRAA
jgi:ribosomal protein S18 acetylase RimI-like enzyme